jgi:transcription elongation factor Elf1
MSKSKKPISSWQQALAFINKCPLCGAVYNAKQAVLCAEDEKAHLVHLACPTCQSYFMVMILMIGQNASSVGMITDLNVEDTKRLYKAAPITLNEAINGYKFMESKHFHTVLLNQK